MPNENATCRAAVFYGPGQPLVLQSLPVPEPRDGEAVVRIECTTICGSDLHTLRGLRSEPVPTILGHEALGTIEAVSGRVCDLEGQALSPGDRVTWSAAVGCGSCDRCRNGIPQKCRTLKKYGHAVAEGRTALSGGLAEFILLQQGSAVVRLGASWPADVFCPASCATATIQAAFRMAGPVAGRRVLILGAGMLGLTAAAMAESKNAAIVVVCEPRPDRLQQASRFGADVLVEWRDDPRELDGLLRKATGTIAFDLVFELSGSTAAVEAACRLGDIAARILLVGSVFPAPPIRVEAEQIVRNWLSIHGVHNYAPDDLRTAVRFLDEHHSGYPFRELVEQRTPLADVNAAIAAALTSPPVRLAVYP